MNWDLDWERIDGTDIERRVAVPWDDDGALSAGEDEAGPWVGVVVEVRRIGRDLVAGDSLWGIEDDGCGDCGAHVDQCIKNVTDEAICSLEQMEADVAAVLA